MDLKEIGKKLAGIGLPLLANAIVPGGGVVASMVAGALGLTDDKPDTIALALQTDPNAAVRLQELQLTHATRLAEIAMQGRQSELEAEAAQQAQINETMRAELKTDNGFKSGWRPFLGWIVSFGIGGILLALINAMFEHPQDADDTIASATVIITMALAVLGVNIKKRSDDKVAGVLGRPIGIMEAVAQRISSKN